MSSHTEYYIRARGTGKTFIVNMIKRDIAYFLKSVVNAGDDQPMVLVTAPTGSVAFEVGGSTIHSAFLLYDKAKAKTSWKKYTTMQLKPRTSDVVFDR